MAETLTNPTEGDGVQHANTDDAYNEFVFSTDRVTKTETGRVPEWDIGVRARRETDEITVEYCLSATATDSKQNPQVVIERVEYVPCDEDDDRWRDGLKIDGEAHRQEFEQVEVTKLNGETHDVDDVWAAVYETIDRLDA